MLKMLTYLSNAEMRFYCPQAFLRITSHYEMATPPKENLACLTAKGLVETLLYSQLAE